MYEPYWGLQEKPFENTPDPKYLYYSQKHKEAIARLLYAVRERKGAGLLTGEYGSGKTLLSRILWNELQQDQIYHSAFILNPCLTDVELLQELCRQFGVTDQSSSKIDLFNALHNVFFVNHNAGKHSVVVIDEAQAITNPEIFEELRLLLNFQLNNAFLLTVVLLGQPELRTKILRLPQLAQRISIRYHLSALNETETKEYVFHRLAVAGAARRIFDDDAYKGVYIYSGGVPRRINNLCDLALLTGFGAEVATISRDTVARVSEDLEAPAPMVQDQNLARLATSDMMMRDPGAPAPAHPAS